MRGVKPIGEEAGRVHPHRGIDPMRMGATEPTGVSGLAGDANVFYPSQPEPLLWINL